MVVSNIPRQVLAAAVAAHQAGRVTEARQLYDQVLAVDPANGWAQYFRGVLAQNDDDIVTAKAHFRAACDVADGRPEFHIALGNLELAGQDAAAAAVCFRAAIAARDDFAAAHTGLCLALKHLGELDAAADAGKRALQLRRGWRNNEPPPGFVDPGEAASMRATNRVKLRHDIAQLRFLRSYERIGAEIEPVISGLETLLLRSRALPQETTITALSEADLALTHHAYNRAIYLAEAPRLAGAALNAAAFATADAICTSGVDCFAVLDSALTSPCLKSLQRLLTESTIWFEVKDHGGHLGAYFEEGLACGLVSQIVEELRVCLPHTLRGRRLAQLWAYKYEHGLGGTELHADIGGISVNLWITPDDACLDPVGSGLEIMPIALPPDWNFHRMNVERAALQQLVDSSGVSPVNVAYRCNRMVVFGSRLLHRTTGSHFIEDYPSRRTNITFLFE